jgi:zinc-ribbon domain/Sel1 repeat
LRCARCGNENLEGNRFCGMCGATLLSAPVPVASAPAPAAPARPPGPPISSPAAPAPSPLTSRTSTPVSDHEPSISGPSFLGLNDATPRERPNLSTDPYARPHTRSLEYLLEDDEEPRRGGTGKIILILLALALAVGFGYLRWKNQGLGWLGTHSNKPSAAEQTSETTEPNANPPASSTNPSSPPVGGAGQPSAQPAPDTASRPDVAPTGNAPAANIPPANATAATTPPVKPSIQPDANAAKDAENPSEDSASKPSDSSTKDSAATSDENPSATTTNPAQPVREAPPKPAAAKPTPAVDAVGEARKYLYGRGVPQDCDRGLRLLKPAANQSNSKAMIEMGALYSAGLCTPHDLPTAYRWFALALRKDPENQAVQADLQKLWGEMTQPERQLAIKLSQ